ncbi:unnamed protein product [Prorocentrum cordatum]|uniref:Uncharacterized protein n=1 Tax=Prorocentrum cordatum TaxID=2364126 RepID=A0ABN9UBJ4_9DINO|nr:unnamed protein product [Polarella glacialis]
MRLQRSETLSGKVPAGCRRPSAPAPEPHELRALARHPQMASLEVRAAAGAATLRRGEVKVQVPLPDLRDRMRAWGWEGQNCNRPVLLFGDSQAEVQSVHSPGGRGSPPCATRAPRRRWWPP